MYWHQIICICFSTDAMIADALSLSLENHDDEIHFADFDDRSLVGALLVMVVVDSCAVFGVEIDNKLCPLSNTDRYASYTKDHIQTKFRTRKAI